MNNRLLNARIPTVLGIFIVVLGIILTTIAVKNQTNTNSKASNSEQPQNVKVTNISDNSLTITYETDAPVTGSVSYGKNKTLGESELEDLDKEKGNFSPKKIHSVSLKKLVPNTKYFLAIASGQNTFLNNGSLFEVLTAPTIASNSGTQTIIQGKVILPNGGPPEEAMSYLSADNSQVLSSILKNGKFDFSLKSFRTENLSSYLKIKENTVFKIIITNGSLKSTALISSNQTDSLPTITLSNDYDFTHPVSPIATKSAESAGFPSINPLKENLKPQILTPKENQSFTDQRPQFTGTSLPNEKIDIIIHSDEAITTQITTDSNGNWVYTPPTNLSPGNHTITIKTRDASGILTTLTQSFTVFAAESTTPQPTPTLIILPTNTPTPTPIAIPSLSPTIPIISPAISTTPVPVFIPLESKGELPPTGDSKATILSVSAIASMAIGIVLFLLTRSGRPL